MRRNQDDATEAEQALLQALWDHGPATIRQLAERVYGQEGASVHATVQKLLDRLEAKGFVLRRRAGAANLYEAAVDREALIARRLRAVADSLCGGSLTPLLTHLVQDGALSDRERQDLRALIDRLNRRRRGANDPTP